MNRELLIVDDIVAEAERRFVEIQPRTIALSGGNTPRPFYERLATIGYPWAETAIFFGDERCVGADDPASNYRMANEALLSKVPVRAHRMRGESCDAEGYEAELRDTFGPGVPTFDLVIQGLGADGHTASLFPRDPALTERERLVVRVERPDHARLSLTLPVLSGAKVAMFLVAGAGKQDALAALMADGDIPAAKVASGRVIVIADRAAAAKLPEASR